MPPEAKRGESGKVREMTIRTGTLIYRAGNLVKDPETRRFDNGDGTYTDVMYLRIAIDHDGQTEYVDLEAKGTVRLYLEGRELSTVHPLCKGSFIMVGGILVKRPGKSDLLRIQVASGETSTDYRILDFHSR